ncbi:hypothetical protein L2E82_06226 [Cichorium intybus]|uniref:Uncharacterized protein n=1 Tax=Cichorium intybus TaxID=13427 RepID=A0ACB9H9I3_CICIN|nr:hypothetical protein L2E82_06226 [Cichorium intybus]
MVEVTISLKKIKVRVTEVEGKLYDQCKMEKETNCTIEREDEEDSEDEDLFLTSDEESQARFSDKEDEEDDFPMRLSDEEDEEDDRQSNVQTMVPETVLNSQTCEEKSSNEPEVFRESGDTFNSPLIAVVPTEQIGRHATNFELEETDLSLSQISPTSVNKKVNSLNSKNNSNEPDFSEVDRDKKKQAQRAQWGYQSPRGE